MIDNLIMEDLEKIKSAVPRDFFCGKKVLVTGGAGFIGSWICDVLVDFGANVVALDDFSTGRRSNVDHLVLKNNFRLVDSDVCAFDNEEQFDVVFHLAAHASPDEYMANSIQTLLTSSVGTHRVAELARRNDAVLLFASTSEVYGDAEVVPTPESYWGKVNPIGPRSCYDEGKRFAEALLVAYSKQYGLSVRIPRIFNTYGPRLREDGLYGRALSRFVHQALTRQPITVFGDGSQTRSFCYVTDTVSALMLLATSEKAEGEVVNVGNIKEVTILELAKKVLEFTASKSEVEFLPLPIDDPKRRCPATAKLERLIDWSPNVEFDEGLKRTILWFSGKNH